MISTDLKRVQIQDIVENQLPAFAREDFPLIVEFLKQYYISQEYPGASVDLIQNIDQYLKLETLTSNASSTKVLSDVSLTDTTITVEFDIADNVLGTYQFPERYGLIQIDDEIILYTGKTNRSFTGCIRGFSGVTSYRNLDSTDKLTFSESEIAKHTQGTEIINLSALLLEEFLTKVKYQFSPGFQNRDISSEVNQRLFVSRSKDFYKAKGTDESFKMLFGALYGEDVEVIKPKEFLFRPSDAQYRVTKDLVVEAISGDPSKLVNQTLFQDEYSDYNIEKSYASISDVEKLTYNDKTFYKLSVDFDYSKDITFDGSVFGEFSVHPKTKVITQVSSGSSIVDVDSTVGFPDSGELVATYSSGETGTLRYSSKSINQFFGVGVANTTTIGVNSQINSESDLRLNAHAYGYIGVGTANRVDMRIGSVLSEPVIASGTYYFSENDTAKIKSLGITTSSPKVDSWLYNIANTFEVKSAVISDESVPSFTITTYSKNNFKVGDVIAVNDSSSVSSTGKIIDVINENSFVIAGQGELRGKTFTVERVLLKPLVNPISSRFSYIENYCADVQNTYVKFNQDLLVASSSLPRYNDTPLTIKDRKVVLDGSYSGDTFNVSHHGYQSGDAVFYKKYTYQDPSFGFNITSGFDIEEGIYYIKKIDADSFKLSSSQANLYNENYVSVSGIVTSNALYDKNFYGKDIEHQHLLREIKSPDNKSGNYTTEPGKTGILVNGVEVLNYKSEDVVYYGVLKGVSVASKGTGFDVINPPILNITDEVGTGATATCSVIGKLERIEIIDPGFDYVSEPTVRITGGNGNGATASVNTTQVIHSVSFNSSSTGNDVSVDNNTIGFSTYHKFRNAEKVIYRTDGQTGIVGLTTDAQYYVKTVDASTIKLFEREEDAIVGLNTVSITGYSSGVHRIETILKKRIVSNVVVDNSGSNYQNKERTTSIAGISTSLNQINITNHGYNSGEILKYTSTGIAIGGVTDGSTYYITKVDENNFKLSSIGVGTTAKSFYYNTNQYIDFTSTGSGTHTFNYEPISVQIVGEIGVTTFSGQDFNAIAQPIFRGEIDSINVSDGGVGYGASTIIGYDRQPVFNTESGSGAELLPIISNGRIQEVLVLNQGVGYNSPPDLVVNGLGNYSKLVPVLSNGRILNVKVESPGTGYDDTTTIDVISSGSGAKFKGEIQKWTVNLFEKYLEILSSDDGVLTTSTNEDYGIQYSHLYAPRKLRESIFGKSQDNQVQYGVFDIQKIGGEEVGSRYHSPIIGWAYDGNPIYGPNGFATKSGGVIKTIESGYEKVSKPNRPDGFALGFFVEDYQFTDSGDLDEHNGRFCITPDYPNGVYAYFATISPVGVENDGAFANYKLPVFPYLIGNTFKSKPNPFNFDTNSNQNSYDLQSSEWFRNTSPYLLKEDTVDYKFLYQPNKVRTQTVEINAVSRGSIDNIGIVTGGNNYQVNDKIEFASLNGVQQAKARVSKVGGKKVNSISVASTTVSSLEIAPYNATGSFVAFATSPHNLNNSDLVSLSGFNTSINSLQRNFAIGVSSETFSLTSGVGTAGETGIVTYFNVSGQLRNELLAIKENDILGIGTEKIKVLNVDILNSRLRVLRSVEGTVSSAHTATSILEENTRKFTFTSNPENDVIFELNKEFYFNPAESLGIGTLSGVGIGTTISFSNPGAGITQLYIPTRTAYLPNHQLNTGDTVRYENNDGLSIEVATDPTGVTTYRIGNGTPLFIARVSKDLIGISTFKVGLGSTGTFVGIASTTADSGLLYFTGIGTGVNHSFTTLKRNVVTAEASKNIVTVSTASTHGLKLKDTVNVNVTPGVTQTITVQYSDYNRRFIFNPKTFTSGNVDVSENTIEITDHGFENGDKVIHTASTPSGGLNDNGIYYIRRVTKNKVKLCRNRYQSVQFTPEVVDISSASAGTLSAVNPRVNAYRGNTLKFDLSDSSLSSLNNATLYSAFNLKIYSDKDFTNEFESSGKSKTFEVSRTGTVGVSADAALNIVINDNIPEKLYYKFSPINEEFVSGFKSEPVVDDEVWGNSEIEILNSVYSGTFSVAGIGSTTVFTYNLPQVPEVSSYTSTNSNVTYSTNSESVYGAINEIQFTYKGSNYKNPVAISTITSSVGSNAILKTSSSSIGRILKTEIHGIGFDYPSDNTLRPVLNLPEVLTVESLASFGKIGISSAGHNYSLSPNLVVLDGLTGEQDNDVDIRYNLGDTEVTIYNNTYGLNNTTPTIIPTSNTNGVRIKTISYDTTTKEVTVGLNTSYSTSVPFSVGDKVLIENVSVGVGSTGYGYNSSLYGYSLFTLSKVHIPLGGNVGVVTYSLDGYLDEGIYPGNFDAINSSGKIIPEKDFPQFDVKLIKNNFVIGEKVTSNGSIGEVESWNNEIDTLKVSTTDDFNVGELVVGQTSRTRGIVSSKIDFDAEVLTKSSSIVKKGWEKQTGVLNLNSERLPDNDYYQNFSYSLKSKVSLETWDDAVSSLNHTAGFLKFSDLVIESQDENYLGVYSDYTGSTVDIVTDISEVININCYSDFDLVTENALANNGRSLSDEIYFSSRVLTDYFESFGNRVLTIDDISTQFNSLPRPERFAVVHRFDATTRVAKFFTLVSDRIYTDERQTMFVSIINSNARSAINQYGRVETVSDLGSFDFNVLGSQGQLLFYPTKYRFNDYNVSLASFELDKTIIGIGSTTLGDVANIVATSVTSISSPTDIVSIATTYRTSKLLVEIDSDSGIIESDELNIIHDGTDVQALEYGQMSTDSAELYGSSGLGTYSASISSGNLNVTFNPNAGIACTVKSMLVSLASTTSVGIGTTLEIGTSDNICIAHLNSKVTRISASGSPGINTIAKYDLVEGDEHSGSYVLISIEDTTNNRYEMAEVIVANDSTDVYLTEYGNVKTAVGLGTIGAERGADDVSVVFTPLAGIDVQVRTFQMAIQLIDATDRSANELNLNTGTISAGFGYYEGTEIDVKRAFNMRHEGRQIFQRNFDASDSNVIDIDDDSIIIPGHFFVSGEELVYSYTGGSAVPPVGLSTTKVYAIKVSDRKIRLAETAENALKSTPVPIDITAVGVGTFHTLTSKNQNTKCLIALDNQIQSPIVPTSVTTGLSTNFNRSSDILRVTGVTSFFGGDLIQINNEILRINTVGYGGSATAMLVNRAWMGTGIATHSLGDVVTKITGDYNIVNNTLNFITAPRGATPISSTTNAPDERDWTGITTFSTFQGRTFLRSAAENSSNETYSNNYIFDDISQEFDATEKTFSLTSNGSNIAGFSTNNAVVLINGIFQGPTGTLEIVQDYSLEEETGITSITFAGTATSVAYDPNNANIPVGGLIISVGSTGGLGYQPLVSAGGTAVVSIAGTISSVSIGNSGSGYRSGSQIVNVGVTTQNTDIQSIEYIGTATISDGHITGVAITNPGVGYTSSNPPIVIFDSPLSYSNIPLEYSSDSPSGVGTEATVDITVGQGSSVIDFEIKNLGYRYDVNQILTIPVGGSTGIPTDTSKTFEEFQLTIEKVENDKFSGWHFGELEPLDVIEGLFDGIRKSFTISRNGAPLTIRAATGSQIDVKSTILVFLNDILQVPGEGYDFTGGSTIIFSEAPKGPSFDGYYSGDKCKILFYKGSGDVDVAFNDVLETVKEGDTLQIKGQDTRFVDDIVSSDTASTNAYRGSGVDGDPNNFRTVTWCKQSADTFIDGQYVSKSRVLNSALLYPTTNVIQPVGVASTVAYVESVRTFFDSEKENNTLLNTQNIILTSQDRIVGASATAVVSIAGTITDIVISDGGVGYAEAPSVSIATPVGYGTTARATATANVSAAGTVSSIAVTSPGTAYTYTNPPVVLIEIAKSPREENTSQSYVGDFGVVVGFGTTTIGTLNRYIFDLFVPTNSFLRDTSIVATATTVSGISTGDFFVVKDSNVGYATTTQNSLDMGGNVIGVSTQFVDNVYQVYSSEIIETNVIGVGTTYVNRIFTNVGIYNAESFSSLAVTFDSTSYTFDSGIGTYTVYNGGISSSHYLGSYSWGKIDLGTRSSSPIALNFYGLNGVGGITTSGTISRLVPLKIRDYS